MTLATRAVAIIRLHAQRAEATWADLGGRRRAQELAIMAVPEDARIKDRPDCTDIGRRQYSHLRRFLEQVAELRLFRCPGPLESRVPRAGAREAMCADFGVGVWGFNPKPE
jgi:hypothetical protein